MAPWVYVDRKIGLANQDQPLDMDRKRGQTTSVCTHTPRLIGIPGSVQWAYMRKPKAYYLLGIK